MKFGCLEGKFPWKYIHCFKWFWSEIKISVSKKLFYKLFVLEMLEKKFVFLGNCWLKIKNFFEIWLLPSNILLKTRNFFLLTFFGPLKFDFVEKMFFQTIFPNFFNSSKVNILEINFSQILFLFLPLSFSLFHFVLFHFVFLLFGTLIFIHFSMERNEEDQWL